MKKLLHVRVLLPLALFFISTSAFSQCPVEAFANPDVLQCGDSVTLTAVADGCKPLNNNFNNGTIGTDWSGTPGAVVNDGTGTYACVGPAPEGTHSLWMGADLDAPRKVETNDYDLTQCAATGGNICFWLKYSTQGGPDPCEGIDLPEEGVSLQYSTNGGTTWTTIQYFDPNGGYDPVLTSWNYYCFAIPGAAMTTSTRFRWYQDQASGPGFDTWGLDEMVITLISPGYTFDWAHDAQGPDPLPNTPDVVGIVDTFFVVTYTNGIQTCMDTVSIQVAQPTASASADPTEVCLNGTSQLDVSATLIPPLPQACGQSITGCQGNTEQLALSTGTVDETSHYVLGKPTQQIPGVTFDFCGMTAGNETSTNDQSGRYQFIINQNEFPAYFLGGQLYNLTLFPSASSGTYDNVKIAIGCTNKTEFASNTDFIGGLTTVFTPKPVNFAAGTAVVIDLDQHYDWPGGQNLVIEMTYCGPNNKTGNLFKTATTNFGSIFAHTCQDDCNTSVQATRFQFRPAFNLGICYRPIPDISFAWEPAAQLNDSTLQAPLATMTGSTTFTVTVSDAARPMCSVTDQVTVNVVEPQVTISPSPAYICAGNNSVTLSANALPSQPGGNIVSYSWSPAAGLSSTNTATTDASPNTTTWYYLTVTDDSGCSALDSVQVVVGDPPGPTAVDGNRCGPGTVSIAVTGCNGTVTWYDAATGGNVLGTGNPFTTPSINSTTTFYATCTSSGCESAATGVVATINNAPDASFSYNPNSICQTAGGFASPVVTGSSGTFSSTTGLVIDAATGDVDVANSVVGTYTVTNSLGASPGCPATSATATITISGPPVADFQYQGSPYCSNAANQTPVFLNGGQAGTFSATPAGLTFVSTATGEIDVVNSTPGTYTVSNDIPAQNGCAAVQATFDITINPAQDGSFSYAQNAYCRTGTDPTPTITGTAGGLFSVSPNGLVFVSTSTGEIDLSASATGNYTITYTTAGPCADAQTFAITISSPPVATFNYGNAPYCQSGANALPTFTNGGVAGTFSASPAGLVFTNTATGEVDVAASTAGTYTVTNTVNSAGCAPVVATANITISQQPTADFTYSQAAYCQDEADPTAQITAGSVAGTFSATPAGLVFTNTSNGTIDLDASSTGTYTISNTVPASNGCPQATATQTVTIDPVQDASFNYSSGTYCTTAADPTPTVTGNAGGTFSSTPAGLVFSNPGNGTIDLDGSTPGTYTITYSLAAPCANSSSISVTISNASDASFAYNGPYCLNEATNPTPTFPPGASAGTFSATPAGLIFVNVNTGEIDLAASTAGTYTVTNDIPASSGCPDTETNTVTLSATDDATFSYSASAYCSNGTDPTPTISGTTGGTFSSGFGIDINATTGTIDLSNTFAGTYSVKYVTNGNCADSLTISVTIDDPATPDFNYAGTPFCQSGADPSPTFVNGGVAGTFSEATGNVIFTNISTGEIDLSASSVGTYTIRNTVAANGSCPSDFFEFDITISEEPTADFSYPNQPYCTDGANPLVQLGPGATAGNFTSGSAGLVIADAATGEVDIANSIAGTFTVTNDVAASGGCPAVSATANITLVDPSNGEFSYPGTPYCQTTGTASPSIAAGSVSGTFSSDPNVVINSNTGDINLNASVQGTYWVYNAVNPGNGCPTGLDSTQITIDAPNDATFNFDPQYCGNEADPIPSIPPGSSAGTFSATPAGLVFVDVNTGQIDLDASTPGTYTITNDVTGNGGCPPASATDQVTINAGDDAGFSYAQNTYCAAGNDPTPVITGTPGGVFSYVPNGLSMNTATGEIDLSASVQTNYTITYTTNGSCVDDSSVNLTITDVPAADFSYPYASYCVTENNPFPVYQNGGSPGTFSAIPAGLVFVNVNTGEIDLAASAPNNYQVTNTIAAGNGCPGDAHTTLVSIGDLADAEFAYDQPGYCQNEPNPTPTHTTGSPGTFTSIPAGIVFVSTSTGQIDLAASTPGQYTIRNEVQGAGTCPDDQHDVTVEVFPMPTVVPNSNSPICEGDTLRFTVSTTPANDPTTVFAWSGPNFFNSSLQNPQIDGAASNASGNYTIQITTNGCTSFANLNNVVVNPSSPTTFGNTGPFCADEPATTFTATDNGGTWSGTGITDENTGAFDPALAGVGTHSIQYLNTQTCVLDSVQVVVNEVPVPNFTVSPDNGCVPVLPQFTPSGDQPGDAYFWNFGNGATSTTAGTVSQQYDAAGCFDVSLTLDRNGCTAIVTQQQVVCAFANAEAAFDSDPFEAPTTSPTFDFINTSLNATTYTWNFGTETSNEENPSFTFPGTAGSYPVVLIANNGNNCPDTLTQFVEVVEELIYFVPNTFTPDGDKFNNEFVAVFTSGYDPKQFNMKIFDRWGELLFETNDPEVGWDGTYQNKLCQTGTYLWKIDFKLAGNDKHIVKTGVVNLLK